MGFWDPVKGFGVTISKLNKKSGTGATVTTDYRGGKASEGQPDEKR